VGIGLDDRERVRSRFDRGQSRPDLFELSAVATAERPANGPIDSVAARQLFGDELTGEPRRSPDNDVERARFDRSPIPRVF
jgi:hypothetical protein